MGALLPLLAYAAAAWLSGQELSAPGDGRVALPPGKVADLLDALPDGVSPRKPGAPWPAWMDRSPAAWGGDGPWRRWVELVAALRRPGPGAAAAHAELAVFARLQGRDGDAWAHLLACASEPALVVALVPFFSPGVPQEWIGAPGPLPDGVVLTPALPPSDDPQAGLRLLAGTRIERRELTVGAALCTLTVSVDRDGLEIELRHLAGPPARVRVVPPLPRGVEPGMLFADWQKLPGHEGPVEFALDAESGEHSLWLTFHPPEERWPHPRVDALAEPDPAREIIVITARGDEPHLARFATALSALFGARASLRAEGAALPPGREPLVLRLGGPKAERKLVELIGLAETLALRAPSR